MVELPHLRELPSLGTLQALSSWTALGALSHRKPTSPTRRALIIQPSCTSAPLAMCHLNRCSASASIAWHSCPYALPAPPLQIMVCVYQFAPAGRLAGLRRVSLVFLAMASGVMMLTADSASNTIDLLKAPNPVSSLITISKCDSKKPPEECSYYEGEQGSVDDAKTCMQVVMGGTVMCIILNFLLVSSDRLHWLCNLVSKFNAGCGGGSAILHCKQVPTWLNTSALELSGRLPNQRLSMMPARPPLSYPTYVVTPLQIIDACMEDAQPPEAPAPAAKPATPAMPVEYPLPASFAATPVKAPAAGPTVVEIPPAPMTPVAAVGMATPQQPPVGMA